MRVLSSLIKFRRLILQRGDGAVYLNRWGFRTPWFGIYLHRMDAPDPGFDLHDHPWEFISIILRGGYTEAYASIRDLLRCDTEQVIAFNVIRARSWRAGSVHRIRLDTAHTITSLRSVPTWTLCLTGKTTRKWGFYEVYKTGTIFVDNVDYASERRNIHVASKGGTNERPEDVIR